MPVDADRNFARSRSGIQVPVKSAYRHSRLAQPGLFPVLMAS
jgi:hypothetical protein